jgi:hypothetical protein
MPGGVPEIPPPLASQQLTLSIEVSPAHADPPVKAGVADIGLGLGGLLGTKLATFPPAQVRSVPARLRISWR